MKNTLTKCVCGSPTVTNDEDCQKKNDVVSPRVLLRPLIYLFFKYKRSTFNKNEHNKRGYPNNASEKVTE